MDEQNPHWWRTSCFLWLPHGPPPSFSSPPTPSLNAKLNSSIKNLPANILFFGLLQPARSPAALVVLQNKARCTCSSTSETLVVFSNLFHFEPSLDQLIAELLSRSRERLQKVNALLLLASLTGNKNVFLVSRRWHNADSSTRSVTFEVMRPESSSAFFGRAVDVMRRRHFLSWGGMWDRRDEQLWDVYVSVNKPKSDFPQISGFNMCIYGVFNIQELLVLSTKFILWFERWMQRKCFL